LLPSATVNVIVYDNTDENFVSTTVQTRLQNSCYNSNQKICNFMHQ